MKFKFGKLTGILGGIIPLCLLIGLALFMVLQPLNQASTVQAANLAPAAIALASSETGKQPEQRGLAAVSYILPVVQAAADSLNLKVTDLQAALLSGKSVVDLAQVQKVDLATVKTAVLNSFKSQLAQVVKDGKITQGQSGKAYQTAELWFDELAQLHLSDLYRLMSLDRANIINALMADTAASLKLSSQDLLNQLKAGKSLADIAGSQNVPVQQVKDAALGSFKKQATNLVTAGQITQSQADKLNQTVSLWWDEVVSLRLPAKAAK